MLKNSTLLKLGIGGTILAALCCFTPILLILLGVVGLGAIAGYLDYVLLPALLVFVGIMIYALQKQRHAQACCNADNSGEKP
ncbi:MAG: mercury resistance system transport protein MerF [Herbaspirillum sp.]